MNFDIDSHQSVWHIDVDRYTSAVPQGTGKGRTTMIRMDTAWLIGRRDAHEERNLMHLVAIREARLTTERRGGPASTVRTAISSRRQALAAAGTGSGAG